MVQPMVSVCSHRHMNILNISALYKEMLISSSKINEVQNKNKEIIETVQLYRILQKVQNILVEEEFSMDNGEHRGDREFLREWINVKDDLTKRSLISTLFNKHQLFKLSNDPDELVVSCQRAGSDCKLIYDPGPKRNVKPWIHPDFLVCTSFNLMKGE